MQPTPASPDSAPNPVVEFIRTDRQSAGFVLLGLAALILAVCGWTIYKSTRVAATPEAETQKKDKSDDPFAMDEAPIKSKDPARNDYIVGGILSGAAFLTAAAAALWLLVSIPAPTDARQRADARALILAVGGLIGAILIVAGIWFFYRWSGALTDWREKDKVKEAKWILYPLLMMVCGAGLMFLSAQPARGEERNNSTLRKLVYGANMGLSVLLLFVALVVFNVFIGPKLPNKLDVTETGFYSLSTSSTEYLGRLDQPVTAYAILSDNRSSTEDIRRLLENCKDASGGKFQVKSISPVANKSEYRTLAAKYPLLEANETGVLLTVGDDEKRHSFIRDDEFTQRDAASAPGESSSRSFVGEARLMRELLFLGESDKKAVVYFTQSAGELNIEPAPGEDIKPDASAARLKAYLEKNYLEVKPLRFDLAAPKVPDDAAVVVVAEPASPLTEPQVAALRAYMNEPRGTKKGKLIVMAGARFDPAGKVTRTGLEKLLPEFGVRLDERVLVGMESERLDPLTMIVGFTATAWKAKNPIALALGEKMSFETPLWRQVGVAQGGGPNFRALPLLVTLSGRSTWAEEEFPRDFERTKDELRRSEAVRERKDARNTGRVVGVVVSEGESGRLAVFGSGLIVSDVMSRSGREVGDPQTFELMGGTVDWLRDRPPLVGQGIEAKKYKTFTLPPTADETRGLWFPLLFALMAVTGMGVSVWMIRRRTA